MIVTEVRATLDFLAMVNPSRALNVQETQPTPLRTADTTGKLWVVIHVRTFFTGLERRHRVERRHARERLVGSYGEESVVIADAALEYAPVARRDGLVVTELAGETLVYDLGRHHLHRLTGATATVWRHCDGGTDVVALARLSAQATGADVTPAAVCLALTQLDDAGLLMEPLVEPLQVRGLSRRSLLRRLGFAGAVAVPAIVSMTVPAAAGLSVEDVCDARPCQYSSDCPMECNNCRAGFCAYDLCGFPCDENADLCLRDKSGTCTACEGEPGARTCQQPVAGG